MNMRCAIYRISWLFILHASFYAWDWMPLRMLQRNAAVWSIRASGCNPILSDYKGSPALRVDGKLHHYSAYCTYIDVVLVVMPFVWVFGASRRSNIQRIGIVALLILGWNFTRCWLAVYLDVAGVNRFYAHDLPNYTIGLSIVVVAVVLALRRDFAVRPETASGPQVSGSEFGGHTPRSSGDTHLN